MSTRPNSFKIGLFVLVGIGLLIAGLFAFGARSYFQQQRIFETYVPGEARGLSIGSPVTLRGVTIGKVRFIGFIWEEYPEYGTDYVLIRFEVPKETTVLPPTTNLQAMLNREIARGLRARIQSQGITGTSVLALEYLDPERNPPLKVPWTPKHYYIPSAPGQFSEILSSVEKTLRRLEDLNLSNTMARLDKLLDSSEHLVTHVDQIDFHQLDTNANDLLAELRVTNVKLQATLADARAALKDTDLPAVGRDTRALESRLGDLSEKLRSVAERLDSGNLNEILANTREATHQLDLLLSDLRQQPSSIIFSRPPPPAESVEKPRPH